MQRLPINQMVYGTRSPKKCWLYLQRAGILFSEERVLSPEDFWKAKMVEKKHRYITTAEPTIGELLLRIIVSVNQLSIHGAVADWCQDLAQGINAHSPHCTGHVLQTWITIPRLKSHQGTYRTSPNHQFGILEPEETWCGNTEGNSQIFQQTFN